MASRIANGAVETLEKLGIETIFGIPGSQTGPFYDALYSSSIRHVLVRHEQSASYMADAYAKFTGRIGVCDGTGGPGATNLLTGVATARTDNSPIMVFTGQQAAQNIGKGAFQELDHESLFRPVTKWSRCLLKNESIVETLRKGYELAMSGRPGPVHIDLPVDLQTEVLNHEDERALGQKTFMLSPTVPAAKREYIRDAAELLVNSSRPLIISGGGVHYTGRAWRELRDFAEYTEIPVCTTFNGRGSFPEDHPLSAGRMGVRAATYNNRVLAEANVILALGCRFASLSTRNWSNINPSAILIHVDIDPSTIGKNYPARIGIVGDAGKVLRTLIEEAKSLRDAETKKRRIWLKFLEDAKTEWKNSEWSLKGSSGAEPLKPQKVFSEIRRFFDRRTVFTMDAGNNKLWASTFLEIYEPCTWIQSGSFGPMGYALPAALACKIVEPSRFVVAVCGDGGFYMSLHELSTSFQENIPIMVCIINDMALGTIRHNQQVLYAGRYISSDLVNPDFAAVAEAFGCCGLDVRTPSQLVSALGEGYRAVKNGQSSVIDIHIDREELLPP